MKFNRFERKARASGSVSMMVALGALLMAASMTPQIAFAAPAGENVDIKNAPVGIPSGSATKANPWIIELTEPPAVQGGAPVKRTITIDDLPAIMAGETFEQASKRKADKIAAAVNGVLGAGRATVTQKNTKMIVGYKIQGKGKNAKLVPVKQNVKQSFITITGLYTVPAEKGKPNSGVPAVLQKTNPVLEFGDGAHLTPGSGTPPPPSPGSMGSMSGSGLSTGSGMDNNNQPSLVYFGIDGEYVAFVNPFAGESETQLLLDLSGQLTDHGVANVYDSPSNTLFLSPHVSEANQLVWGDTDTGFDLSVALTGIVPEPGTWVLMIGGLGLAGAALRRRRRIAA
jgi:hypothetical protein